MREALIKSFKNKGLKLLWNKNNSSKLEQKSVTKITRILETLEAATDLKDFNRPSLKFHSLQGDNPTRYSLKVDENFRITFEWNDGDIERIDLEDYH